ncbi:MAG: hypothetical protein JXO44_09360 [Clostridia bacterium]|nr:hypothetical protein [Clostridia bacterium]
MKHFGTVISTAIAGMFVMSVWGAFANEYGIGGGWFAATLIIGTMWYLNHVIGCHNNDGAWVDMALGIGVAGFTRPIFATGLQAGIDSLPTLFWVLVGGAIGGVCAYMLECKVFCEKEA